MAREYATAALCFALLTLLLSAGVTKSANPSAPSPSPDADGPPDDQPPLNFTSNPASLPEFPGPSPAMHPSPFVSPSQALLYGTDADAPPETPPAADHFSGKLVVERTGKGSGGMSGGAKAGVAIGVIAFVGLAALGGLAYRKRKDNKERATYGSAATKDML